MFIEVKTIPATFLSGLKERMSLTNNQTQQLWKKFMPIRHSLPKVDGSPFYSVEVYDNTDHFRNFDPSRTFIKWAALEIEPEADIPDSFDILEIPSGLYAVFLHRGSEAQAAKTYGFIFSEWLPNSTYLLDNRPHFAMMGDRYIHGSEASEEEIYIPVQPR
jgi:AraC family transcriptional regulator